MSGNYLPRNALAEALGHAVFRLMGWRIEGQLPPLDKFVVIGAHHTSNWDFVLFIAAKFILRLNARWFGKHSIFRWPFGALMRYWGGIPIRRHLKLNTVEQAIEAFAEHRQFILVLSPEGTRRKVERWRSGFYHIAWGPACPSCRRHWISSTGASSSANRSSPPATRRPTCASCWRSTAPMCRRIPTTLLTAIDGRHADKPNGAVIVSRTITPTNSRRIAS